MFNRLIIYILFFAISSVLLFAEATEEVKIKTSAQCELCKDRIEKALNKSKGIVSAELDLETKEVSVVYDTEQTNIEKIKEIISKTGYDADDIPANKKAYKKLPKCCQKGGHD